MQGCDGRDCGRVLQALVRSAQAAAVGRKLRVNLRPLAEVHTLLWTPVALLLAWLAWRALLLVVQVVMLPLEDLQAAASSTVQTRSQP